MSFLDLSGKTFLVAGVANRKSIAYVVSQLLESEGAKVIYSVRSQKRKDELQKYLKERTILICDFEEEDQINDLGSTLKDSLQDEKLSGILHSIAFANFSEGLQPFHKTKRKDSYKRLKYPPSLSLNWQMFVNHFSAQMHQS